MLKVGDKVPEFEGEATSGERITNETIRGKWTVLFFYPKAFTPGCTREVCSIRDGFDGLSKLGVFIFGVSRDKLETQRRFKEKYSLPYELIADPQSKIISAFGVKRPTGSAERKTFIISPEGKIAFVFDKVKVDEHHKELTETLRKLMGSSGGTY